MILVYADKKSNRLAYTLDTVIKGLLRSDYKFTADKNVFLESDLPKISYTDYPLGQELFIKSSGFLYEKGIRPLNVSVADWNGLKVLFPHDFSLSEIPFDLFAAVFYLLSRYEEYLPSTRDKYGRFDPQQSIAFREGFLKTPIVDVYAARLKSRLLQHYPDLDLPVRQFRFIPTFDIDHAFAYLHKGVFRTLMASVRSLLTFDFRGFYRRIRVLQKFQEDPYDSFEWIRAVHEKYHIRPLFFFLLGDYGRYDKNIPHNNKEFQRLIKDTSIWSDIGIHPSYHTPTQPQKLKAEIKRLNHIGNQVTVRSRQHFLRLLMPASYRNLLQTSILEDYTMGYGPMNGFRASTCTPFYFYDLGKDERSPLKIFPFCFMDSTWKYYINKPADEAIKEIEELMNAVQKAGGTFVTLFHNDTFMRPEWKLVYEELLKKATALTLETQN